MIIARLLKNKWMQCHENCIQFDVEHLVFGGAMQTFRMNKTKQISFINVSHFDGKKAHVQNIPHKWLMHCWCKSNSSADESRIVYAIVFFARQWAYFSLFVPCHSLLLNQCACCLCLNSCCSTRIAFEWKYSNSIVCHSNCGYFYLYTRTPEHF